jgi:ribonuclease T2
MKKLLLLSLVAMLAISKEAIATKECEAYNILRHSKNDGDITLQIGQSYKILDSKKNSYYITVPNANPQNRWVDISCFNQEKNNESKSSILDKVKSIFSKNKNDKNLDSVLVLSWHNSFCETHANKKECKLNGGDAKNRLVLHGLWPQPRNNVYCGVDKELIKLDKAKMWNALPEPKLSKEVKELLKVYMPGFKSNLHRHEWIKHGTCYTKDANRYFLDALTLTKKLDSTIGEYLRANIGSKVKTINLKKVASKLIDSNIKNKIAVKCKRVILNEIWLSIKGKGSDIKKLIKNAKPIKSNCVEFIVDAPGKFKR